MIPEQLCMSVHDAIMLLSIIAKIRNIKEKFAEKECEIGVHENMVVVDVVLNPWLRTLLIAFSKSLIVM